MQEAASATSRHPIAFSIQVSRNLVVQGLGMGMVSLMGLMVAPPVVVAAWTVFLIAMVMVENRVMRLSAGAGPEALAAGRWAPVLRILITLLYATAAYALIVRGGVREQMFAFALIAASMVHVLMRHYRSPRVLLASISPYLVVLGLVGSGLTWASLAGGDTLGALAPVFTIGVLGVQFWSARAQLAAAWMELMGARDSAQARECAAEAANQAKSEFLSNMSHELRTPLNGVLGMAQALSGDRLSAAQQERVAIIRRSSESLLSVLNDLLDLSKIEAQALDFDLAPFDLQEVVSGVEAAFRPTAQKKGLVFETNIDPGALGAYRGDAARVRRILYTLADNAVKFTDAGSVRLEAACEACELVFRVRDTGIGISEASAGRLFEGFYQGDASLTRRHGGAGIGLAVCRQLTDRMGGVIEMTSQVGVGSVFTLRLPLERLMEAPAEADEASAGEAGDDAPLRVLVAEDNLTNQLVIRTLLAAAGIEPALAADGREAVDAWEAQAWDVILMDIQMPVMDGIAAARAIRAGESRTGRRRTPIIAVTANAMTHQVAEYEAAGMDGLVPKPIDMTTLFNAIVAAQGAGDVQEAEAVSA